ncbi:MAG: hypothetical protein QOC97_885 [Chloroflexota bacterium]|nr:hypothetical protein [Chloroflexota bacterium]
MDPEDPGLVARGRDDTPRILAATPADDDRPTPELGPVALLDRREEGIEVDVQDRSRGHRRYHRPAVEPPAADARTGIDWPSPVTTAGVLIGIAAAAVVAWAVPFTAIVIVWPILFFVPGWVVIRRVVPDLPAPGAVGAAIVTSVYVSAHLVNVVARVGGVGRGSIIASAVLLVLATLALTRIRHRWLAPLRRPTRDEIVIALWDDGPAWFLAVATGLIVFTILMSNGWSMTPNGWVSGGWNWSDLLVHVAIGSSIAAGNFPPEVPYFAGVPLTYHWFADFHGAITSTVAGVDLIPVYFLTSALFAAVLALVVWGLAVRLTASRRVAAIATFLVCFGGGLGWIRLVGDLIAGGGNVVDLVSRTSYDNTWIDGWPWFKIASIFGTGFLPHRATTLGLPGLVTVVLLVVACLGRRPLGVLLAGILAALLAPFQFFAFPATYLIVFLYVVTTGGWRVRTVVRDALLFLVPVVLAAPFIVGAIVRQGDIGSFRFVLGWSEARLEDGPAAVLFFYLTNLGIPFALAVISAIAARRLPGRWFLVAWLVALFIVPNVVVVSAVVFDMNKYFQIMWIAVAILAAWLIQRWPRPIIAAVLLVSAFSPALIGIWHMRSTDVAVGLAQETASHWIAANTPERTVFVTDAYINSPVDLAGRLRISTFGPYVSNLGYDPDPRALDTTAIYCDGPDVAAQRMAIYGATYVLSSGGIPCEGAAGTDFSSSPRFETVYDADGVTIWRLAGS